MQIVPILALGIILRLISINQSLWLDEATSAVVARDYTLFEIITKFSPGDFHPPLYYIFLKVWVDIFGSSELSVRFPSILFGVGTIYLVYLITKILTNSKVALMAAFLLAVAPLHIYYSQEARMYSQAGFFVALSIYLFLKQKHFYSGLFLTSAIFTDYLAIFMLPVFWFYKKDKRLIFFHLPLLIGVFLWANTFLSQLAGGLSVKDKVPQWWNVLGGANFKQIALVPIKFLIGRISFSDKYIYALFISIGLVGSFIGLINVAKKFSKFKLIWFWLILPILLAIIVSLKIPVLSYFRLLFVVPSLYILLAIGLSSKKLIYSLFVSFSLLASLIYLSNPKYHREDWRGFVDYINKSDKNASVLFATNSQMEAFNYYSYNMPIKSYHPLNKVETETIWLMRYVQDIFDPEDKTRLELEESGYKKLAEHSFNGVVAWKYKKTP